MEATKNSFEDVLKKAQSLGYAEPGNPKLDLNGYDALAKVKILSSLSFNNKISNSKYLEASSVDISLPFFTVPVLAKILDVNRFSEKNSVK